MGCSRVPTAGQDAVTPGRGGWVGGVLLACLVLAWFYSGTEAAASYHGLVHGAITQSVHRTGVPPEDPFFAGETIRYYWVHHALATLMPGTGPLAALAILNALAALLIVPGAAGLARRLDPSRGSSAAGVILVLAGFNAAGFIPWAMAGFPWTNEGAPLASLSALTWPGGDPRNHVFLAKYLNLSSFPLGLSLAVWSILRVLEGSGRLTTGVLTGAALAVNPLAAGPFVAGSLVVGGRARAGVLVGVAVGAVTLWSAGGGSDLGWGWPGPGRLLTGLGAPAAVMLVLASRRPAPAGAARLALLVVAGVSAAGWLFLRLPLDNEYKFVRTACLALCVLAAPAAAAVPRKGQIGLACVLVPCTVYGLAAYGVRAGRDMADAWPSDSERSSAIIWLKQHSEPEAVVVVWERASATQGSRVAWATGRPVFVDPGFHMSMRHDGYADRMAILEGLARGGHEGLARARAAFDSLGRPIYLLPPGQVPDAWGEGVLERVAGVEGLWRAAGP